MVLTLPRSCPGRNRNQTWQKGAAAIRLDHHLYLSGGTWMQARSATIHELRAHVEIVFILYIDERIQYNKKG